MLVISGSVDLDSGPSVFHGVDNPLFLETIFKPITKYSRVIRNVSELFEVLERAYYYAISGRKGPVYIGVPYKIESSKVGEIKMPVKYPEIVYPYSKHKFQEILNILNNKKIVVIIGTEVFTSIDSSKIINMADSLNSPVICEIEGLGYIPQSSKFYAGYIEEQWDIHPSAINVLKYADYILCIGLRPGEAEYNFIKKYSNATIIHIGYTKSKKVRYVKHSVTGDLEKYIDGLISIKGYYKDWYSGIISRGLQRLREIKFNKVTHRGLLNPLYVAYIISMNIKENSILIVDIGSHETYARLMIGAEKTVRYLYPGNYGSMGFALPAGIGAYLAGYNEVNIIIGDGGMLMCMEELATISEFKPNIKIFVFNDSQYGMIYHMQKIRFGETAYTKLSNVDFSKIAEGFGVESIRIADVKDNLENTIYEVMRSKGPILVDIVVDHMVKYITFR